MEAPLHNKRHAILYVDDEEKSLKYFQRLFESEFWIMTASSAREGLRLLEEQGEDLAIVITDQRMPGDKGTWLLEQARQIRPSVVRILVTAYADLESTMQAVNTGGVYYCVNKPWNIDELRQLLQRGMRYFTVQQQRELLFREKLALLRDRMFADRMASLRNLTTGLNHHIRNALVPVRAFLDLAPQKLLEEQVRWESLKNTYFWRDFHQQVEQEIDRVVQMLNDLGLIVHESIEPNRVPVKIDALMGKKIAEIQDSLRRHQITIQQSIPASLPELRVDLPKFERLCELLLNETLVNLPNGGRVVMGACLLPGANGTGEFVQLQISDDGPGLSKEHEQLLFEPFIVRQDQPRELGINLMVSYFIVSQHGGTMKLSSAQGQGTLITLTLPVTPPLWNRGKEESLLWTKMAENEALWEDLQGGRS